MNYEIDAFLFKFHQLWNAGLDAHLDLHTNAGKAWIGIKLDLGEQHQPFTSFRKNVASPSRVRRRNRRAAERLARETLNISSSISKPNDVTVQELTPTEIVATATDDNQQPDVENPNLDDISAPSLEEIQSEVVSSQNVDNVHTEKVAPSHSEESVHTEKSCSK